MVSGIATLDKPLCGGVVKLGVKQGVVENWAEGWVVADKKSFVGWGEVVLLFRVSFAVAQIYQGEEGVELDHQACQKQWDVLLVQQSQCFPLFHWKQLALH